MITVKHDPTIDLPAFNVPINSDNVDDKDKDYKERQQTKSDGIVVPLLRINGVVVDGRQVKRLKLKLDKVPTLDVTIQDKYGIISTFDNPDNDSQVQLQIIPSYDKTYKKINLVFYIERCSIREYEVSLHCTYIIPHLYDNVMRSYDVIFPYALITLS